MLNDPFDSGVDGPRVVLASVCSIPSVGGYDPSCSFFPGEHPFIQKHSYVAYRFCSFGNPATLEQKVVAGTFIAKPLLDENYFQMVVDGLGDSPDTVPKFRNFLSKAYGWT